MPVLLIDRDQVFGRAIRQSLALARFTTDWVTSDLEALQSVTGRDYDVVLLRSTGLSIDTRSLLRALRSEGVVATIVVLAAGMRSEDRIAALDAGADDCLSEPFETPELLAKIRVSMRRKCGRMSTELVVGSLRLDVLFRVAREGDLQLDLTSTEIDLLEALMRSGGGFVDKARLSWLIYGAVQPRMSNAVQVHLHNLRCKLGAGTITNVRGKGYRIETGSLRLGTECDIRPLHAVQST